LRLLDRTGLTSANLRESPSPRFLAELTEGVVAVPAPSNYDDSGMMIRVDPDSLYRYATVDMPNQADVIGSHLNNIVDTWNGLQLGWAGTTAQEVQDFSNQWIQAIQQLFGTEADPATGALPKIAMAVNLAAVNYGEAEDVIIRMFTSLLSGLIVGDMQGLGPNAPHSINPPPTRTPNPLYGPITESSPPPS
jgi:uncharacterized protein YukE